MLIHHTGLEAFMCAKLVFPPSNNLRPKCSLTIFIADRLSMFLPLTSRTAPRIYADQSCTDAPHSRSTDSSRREGEIVANVLPESFRVARITSSTVLTP